MDSDEIVKMLLEQNRMLIQALVGSSPVEIVRALNPPVPPPPVAPDFWGTDQPHAEQLDAWGDDRVTSELLLGGRGGWVAPDVVPTDEGEE